MQRVLLACFAVALLASALVEAKRPSPRDVDQSVAVARTSDPRSPDFWCLRFATNVNMTQPGAPNDIAVQMNRTLAPIGVDHLYAIVTSGFFGTDLATGAAFFRVVPQFVVQFGIAGVPAVNAAWQTPILDDPVLGSNLKGTLTYATAGQNTRTTQLFINTADNPGLDNQGFAPLGAVVEGFDVTTSVYNPTPNDSDGIDQNAYTQQGNPYIEQNYPGTNFILGAKATPGKC